MFFYLKLYAGYITKPILGVVKRALTNSSGTSAVEFSFVALPFLTLLFAILEVSLVFFGGQALEYAVDQTGRLVRTGQAQSANMSASDFKDKICEQIVSIFDCKGNLQVELVTFNNFQAASDYAADAGNSAVNSEGELRDDFTFEANSSSEQIVLLRAFFEWDLTLAFPGTGLDNMDNGKRLLTAVTIFKNEPFD